MPNGHALSGPSLQSTLDGAHQAARELGISDQSIRALAGTVSDDAATKRARAVLDGDQVVAHFHAPEIAIWARFPISSESEADIDIMVNGRRAVGLLHWEEWAIEEKLTEPELAGVADLLQAVMSAIP